MFIYEYSQVHRMLNQDVRTSCLKGKLNLETVKYALFGLMNLNSPALSYTLKTTESVMKFNYFLYIMLVAVKI